jgi:putative transposase
MPSYARRHQLNRSLTYHIYSRGNLRLEIFHSEQDFHHYLRLIKEYSYSFGVKIYHWVLMPNHYHLLLELDVPENLSIMMAGLNRAYTHYYHATYHTAGYLWQGRFKSQPVEKERYLIACGRYIERNPVRAGMVLEAYEYPYSSARFYCTGQSDGITTEDPAFCEFGRDIMEKQNSYKEFLRKFDSEEEKFFEDLEKPLGSQEFIRRLLRINGRYMPRRKGGIPKTLVV